MLKTINNDKILWIPLDLPPIEKEITLDNINNFYNFVPNVSELERKKFELQKQHYKYAWNTVRLRTCNIPNESWETQNLNEEWHWNEVSKKSCPKLINYINTYLPFKSLKAVSIMSSNGFVPAHYDISQNSPLGEKINYIDNEPSIYRLIVDGSIKEKSFYVYNKLIGKKYITMPEESPGWIMGALSCVHGNDENIPHQKLLVYIMGNLDKEKHIALLENSYKKYKKFSIEL